MYKPLSKLLCAGLILVTAGCGIASLISLPFDLVFGAVSALFEGVSSLVGLVAVVEPIEGPAPTPHQLGDGRWALAGVTPDSRFDVLLTAPGHEPRRVRWPDDFRDSVATPEPGGRLDLTIQLQPTAPSARDRDDVRDEG